MGMIGAGDTIQGHRGRYGKCSRCHKELKKEDVYLYMEFIVRPIKCKECKEDQQ